MTNLNMLETFRTKEELLNYFDEIGQNITEEEIEELKQSYAKAEENGSALSLQQLDDVAGGGLFAFAHNTGELDAQGNKIYKLKAAVVRGDDNTLHIMGDDGTYCLFRSNVTYAFNLIPVNMTYPRDILSPGSLKGGEYRHLIKELYPGMDIDEKISHDYTEEGNYHFHILANGMIMKFHILDCDARYMPDLREFSTSKLNTKEKLQFEAFIKVTSRESIDYSHSEFNPDSWMKVIDDRAFTSPELPKDMSEIPLS